MLEVSNLNVRLARKHILHDVTFQAQPGKMLAIVGPNGSGKSTLLKAVTGELPSSGAITLNGLNVHKAAPHELAAIRGVLPQHSSLSFPFTVAEVVAIGLTDGAHADQTEAVPAALRRTGVLHLADSFYQECSGGEQQRVQLARVLVQIQRAQEAGVPRWLFLDEPVSSLDIAHQLHVMQIARDFASAGGGVVAVMHDLNLSAMFADEVLVMKSGAVAAHGPADETLKDDLLSDVYECHIATRALPAHQGWFFLPQAAARA